MTFFDDWTYAFFHRWEHDIRGWARQYCWTQQNADEAVANVICEVFDLLKYVQHFDAEFLVHGIDQAIESISKTRIPCVEKKTTERHVSESRNASKQKKERQDLASDPREHNTRQRLREAYGLLPLVSSEHENKCREYVLLVAILATKYQTKPIEKTFLQNFTRNQCTKVNREKNKWRTIDKEALDRRPNLVESKKVLLEAVDKLPLDYQILLRLLFEDGESLEEAADILGVSYCAVQKRKSRAIKQLRSLLKE
jgi:RNA polymerase sigma factor (sigma-70 family)